MDDSHRIFYERQNHVLDGFACDAVEDSVGKPAVGDRNGGHFEPVERHVEPVRGGDLVEKIHAANNVSKDEINVIAIEIGRAQGNMISLAVSLLEQHSAIRLKVRQVDMVSDAATNREAETSPIQVGAVQSARHDRLKGNACVDGTVKVHEEVLRANIEKGDARVHSSWEPGAEEVAVEAVEVEWVVIVEDAVELTACVLIAVTVPVDAHAAKVIVVNREKVLGDFREVRDNPPIPVSVAVRVVVVGKRRVAEVSLADPKHCGWRHR